MFKRPPLKIDCDGLSQKLIADLADRLRLHFVDVDVFGDIIYAANPLGWKTHYDAAWRILDAFGVKVT
ncbi:MAG: hypothetical protein IJ774_07825 [Selenomonadaceae bacterium]|nr:hypothetical protein [Selenomonadaceae bacterium]